ncbi:MAG: anhydro-N-acetylmuramic acid kinase [Flavobacteriales bacterium]|nr:anhydro-N-acetylmuramic acid kinase [Flavobacteriales bacterium]
MSKIVSEKSYYAIGLMSGTSLDGLDIAYSHFVFKNDEWSFNLLSCKSVSYTAEMKSKLKSSIEMSGLELTKFDVDLGKFFAVEVEKFINEEKITRIDVIGSHGHTVFHQPEKGFTVQIGDASWIHNKTKKTVVADFRSQDVALGGQGAPLVPIGDKLLFSDYDYRINLGGFANISFEENGSTSAFDVCAVNTILNKYSNDLGYEYDDKGEMSKGGKIIPDLLIDLEAIDFYKQNPPKSLGVEWNKKVLLPILDKYSNKKIEDVMHTYTKHVASQISKVLRGNGKKVLISGGGAFNDFLISLIKKDSSHEIIVEGKELTDFKEAIIFSFLAILRIRREVNCLAEVTGASADHSSGVVHNYLS